MPIPMTLIFILLAILLLWKHRKLALMSLLFAISLLTFYSSEFGSRWLALGLENQYQVNSSPIKGGCAVMVLGSGADDTLDVPDVMKLSPTGLERLTEGVRQFHLGQNCQLFVSGWSGGQGRPFAEVSRQVALSFAIPSTQITMFPLAKDTIEEAHYFAQKWGNKPFRLVTSATHMPRAMSIFEAQGLSPTAAPTGFMARDSYWWVLSADNLLTSQRSIHEYLGQAWIWLKTHLK